MQTKNQSTPAPDQWAVHVVLKTHARNPGQGPAGWPAIPKPGRAEKQARRGPTAGDPEQTAHEQQRQRIGAQGAPRDASHFFVGGFGEGVLPVTPRNDSIRPSGFDAAPSRSRPV